MVNGELQMPRAALLAKDEPSNDGAHIWLSPDGGGGGAMSSEMVSPGGSATPASRQPPAYQRTEGRAPSNVSRWQTVCVYQLYARVQGSSTVSGGGVSDKRQRHMSNDSSDSANANEEVRMVTGGGAPEWHVPVMHARKHARKHG
jgi:hypothetical protein